MGKSERSTTSWGILRQSKLVYVTVRLRSSNGSIGQHYACTLFIYLRSVIVFVRSNFGFYFSHKLFEYFHIETMRLWRLEKLIFSFAKIFMIIFAILEYFIEELLKIFGAFTVIQRERMTI